MWAAASPTAMSVLELFAALWLGTSPGATPASYDTVRVASGAEPGIHVSPGGVRVGHLTARTPYGSSTRLWVRVRRDGWLKVSTTDAPGNAGWIQERDTRPAPALRRRIVIDRSARRLTVIGAGRTWSTRVVVGGPSSPTPTGTFQVTDRLHGTRFGGTYGDWVFPLSAYGTPARTSRLAVHGRPPAARSATESAGCIRVPAGALATLARQIPPGTPVRIRA